MLNSQDVGVSCRGRIGACALEQDQILATRLTDGTQASSSSATVAIPVEMISGLPVAATTRIIHARAKQPHFGIITKVLVRCLEYALLFCCAASHSGLTKLLIVQSKRTYHGSSLDDFQCTL